MPTTKVETPACTSQLANVWRKACGVAFAMPARARDLEIAADVAPLREHDDYTGKPIDESTIVARASIEDGIPVPLAPESIDAAWEVAMNYLHAIAENDKLVLALLDAYEHDARTKRDVMKLRKWKSSTYKTAYGRLIALAEGADPAVREAIFYAFTN